MRAITLWQPWASAMTVQRPAVAGAPVRMLKGWETRGWAPDLTSIGARYAICAAKSNRPRDADGKAVDLKAWWMENVKRKGGYRACFEKAGFTDFADLPFGAVVGHAVLTSVRPAEELVHVLDGIEQDWGIYSPGRFGWEFTDMVVLPRPVPIVGRQGIFWWDEQEVAA